ncbi:hypothetical protein H5410_029361, partial [Solanum commersonii]
VRIHTSSNPLSLPLFPFASVSTLYTSSPTPYLVTGGRHQILRHRKVLHLFRLRNHTHFVPSLPLSRIAFIQ